MIDHSKRQLSQIFLRALFISMALVSTMSGRLHAQNDTLVPKVIVGIKITPPFIMKEANGDYTGISVDLWEEIAKQQNLVYEYREYTLKEVLDAVKDGEVDICINPITVTSERLKAFDFTQPYFISNLAIAVSVNEESELWVAIKNFFSLDFFKAIFLLFVIILIFGLLVWIPERKHNEQFRKGWRGIFDGIWWSAVTMTTVGYGDKAPKTLAGKLIGSIWMFTAIITITGFTAGITATLTVNELGALKIETLDDLRKAQVGTLLGSSSEEFLRQKGLKFKTYPTALAGLNDIYDKKLDGFLFDEPLLRYHLKHSDLQDRITLLPQEFNKEYYSFAMPDQHPLLDVINPILIEQIESRVWQNIKRRYQIHEEEE